VAASFRRWSSGKSAAAYWVSLRNAPTARIPDTRLCTYRVFQMVSADSLIELKTRFSLREEIDYVR